MLTDIACKTAKLKDKPYKLFDERSLYLHVQPNGSRYFRLKYQFAGKEKILALGVYPNVTLKEARDKAYHARKNIADGQSPSLKRKLEKLGINENSFKAIALEWYGKHMTDKSVSHQKRNSRILYNDLLPWLGEMPIGDKSPGNAQSFTADRKQERGRGGSPRFKDQ